MMSEKTQRPLFVAVDWGTTNLRAYLVSADGRSLAAVSSDEGLLRAGGRFQQVLSGLIGPWLKAHDALPVLMSGMVGSRSGWKEAPYVEGVVNAQSLARQLVQIEDFNHGNTWIIPGVCATSCCGQPDVMRGEEIQIVGTLRCVASGDLPTPDYICLPGTHDKWVQLKGGEVDAFSTAMTGELFNLLSSQSILSQSVDKSAPWNADAFIEGLEVSTQDGGLLHQLFSVRARQLCSAQDLAQGNAYLSGLLIGNEIRSMLNVGQPQQSLADAEVPVKTPLVTVISSESLAEHYKTALNFYGFEANSLSSTDATVGGMFELVHTCELTRKESCS